MQDTRLLENSMGDVGIEYISDTETHSVTNAKTFVGLIVTSDVTIEEISVESNTGNTLVAAILPVGSYPFRFTSIKLTSGTGIAIKGA